MAVGTLGISIFAILPVVAVEMMEGLGLNKQQVGVVGSAALIGIAVGSIANIALVKRLALRRLAYLGLIGLLAADFCTLFIDSHNLFVVSRFISGFAGGMAVSFAAYALGKSAQPDRNFGTFLIVQVTFGIIALLTLPYVIGVFGMDGVFASLCIVETIAILLLVPKIPNVIPTEDAGSGGSNTPLIWKFCATVLLAIFCFYMAIGGFWTFIGPIGIDGGLSREAASMGLGVGLLGGLAGAATAASLNIRYGRVAPVLFAVGSQLLALLMLSTGFDLISYVIAAFIFSFGWYMYFPYLMGLLAAMDRDGRSVLMGNVCAGMGSGLGPVFAAAFLANGFAPTYVICFGFLVASVLLTTTINIVSRSHLKDAPAG